MKNNRIDFIDRILFSLLLFIFVADLPWLIKPVFKVFKSRLKKKYRNNKEIMAEIEKLEDKTQR